MVLRDDDYELMPHQELEYLRKEVERLKRNPLGDTQASVSLLDSINKLNTNVTRLNDILSSANDEMVKAYQDTAGQDRMRKLLEQQEKLARGIVAVAELVKDLEKTRALPPIDSLLPSSQQSMQSMQPSMQPSMHASQASAQQIPDISPRANVNVQAVRQRNPFAENPDYQPILNQPLPRQASQDPANMQIQDISFNQQMSSQMPGQQPTAQNQNAPGFMLHPGVQGDIPDMDVPLPPAPRRYPPQ